MVRWCWRILLRSNFSKGYFLGAALIYLYVNVRIPVTEEPHTKPQNAVQSGLLTELKMPSNRQIFKRRISASETGPRKVLDGETSSSDKVVDNYQDTQWVEVQGSNKGLFLYSAFHDTRTKPPTVRIIAILKKRYRATDCQIWTKNGKVLTTRLTLKVIRENWGLAYSAAFVLCQDFTLTEDDVITEVGVRVSPSVPINSRLRVISLQGRDWEGQFSVCVKPLHYEFNRSVWLVEFIELHRIMGVEKFFFYNHTIGKEVEEVLHYYRKERIVKIFNWALPVITQKEIRTEGIFAALNDCNLRNVGKYHHTLMIDLDEFIIPRRVDNYAALLNSLGPPKSAYVFKNVFFYLYFENDTVASNTLYENSDALGRQLFGSESEGPYLLTAYKTVRLRDPHKHGSRSKYIVKPEFAVECGNHRVWEFVAGLGNSMNVKETEAIVHHYRICEFGGFECLKHPHKVDRTAHKYLPTLVKAVANVCSNIFPRTGICPKAPPLGSPW